MGQLWKVCEGWGTFFQFKVCKGGVFCQIGIQKGKGIVIGVEPPRIKLLVDFSLQSTCIPGEIRWKILKI